MKILRHAIIPLAAIAALGLAPSRTEAQNWRTADLFRNNNGQNYVRLEGASGKMNFGFIDLTEKGYFGQMQASHPISKGFTIGAEYEGIANAPDSFRPQIGFNTKLGPAVIELRYAPIHLMGPEKQQASLFALLPVPKAGGVLSTWNDHDWNAEGPNFAIGEIQYSRPVHKKLKGLDAAVIASYNKSSKPVYSAGIRQSF